MTDWFFTAMGTEWQISVDDAAVAAIPESVQHHLIAATAAFEAQFSRFLPDSEVSAFRTRSAGTYPISTELAMLLRNAEQLRTLTQGGFDPAVGGLLEHAGYDPKYSLQAQPDKLAEWQLPRWDVSPNKDEVTISGPVVFDLGGTGKGYWIDQLSRLLHESKLPFHLVEGGGDMFGTTKQDGSAWRVALELPGKPDMAYGTAELTDQGLAVSDTLKRKWGDWNHLVQGQKKEALTHLMGCTALAPSAWLADQLTAVLPHLPPSEYLHAGKTLQGEYIVLLDHHQAHVSPQWPGTFFSE